MGLESPSIMSGCGISLKTHRDDRAHSGQDADRVFSSRGCKDSRGVDYALII